jgi:hypothetical protein
LRSAIDQYSVSRDIATLPNGSISAASVLFSIVRISALAASQPTSSTTLPT